MMSVEQWRLTDRAITYYQAMLLYRPIRAR